MSAGVGFWILVIQIDGTLSLQFSSQSCSCFFSQATIIVCVRLVTSTLLPIDQNQRLSSILFTKFV
jgi:hypothetical protein